MRLAARLRTRLSDAFTLDVDLSVEFPRDLPVAALFGPSGCGKSTTLAVLAGLQHVDEGRIELGGDVVLDTAAGVAVPPERRRVALVAQDGLLFPHLTVVENLRYADRRAAARQRPELARVLDVLELGSLSDRRPARLSGGERQRVALGRALLCGPRLLLLDEPVSALDERARWRVLEFVERTVAEFSVPTLYVSHARVEVLRLARTAARLQAGRVVETGDPARVLASAPPGATWNLVHAVGAAPPGERSERATAGRAEFFLPGPVDGGADVWLRLSSAAIALRPRGADVATSARNRLPGRVLHLAEEGGRVRVSVDAGVPLQVDVTSSSVRELSLAPGSAVLCEFKAYALEMLGG